MAAESGIIRPYTLYMPIFSRKACYHYKLEKAHTREAELICACQSLDYLISG